MHEARIRQALRQLETKLGQMDVKCVARHILHATGYKPTANNVDIIVEKLTLHIANFAPKIDNISPE